MATEVVRQVWCDIDLKARKKKVAGREKRATALHEGKIISIDTCDKCYDTLTWSEILQYGSSEDQPRFDPAKISERIKETETKSRGKGKRGGNRDLVQCSNCGKQCSTGAGWVLHKKVHDRKNEEANPLPLAS